MYLEMYGPYTTDRTTKIQVQMLLELEPLIAPKPSQNRPYISVYRGTFIGNL